MNNPSSISKKDNPRPDRLIVQNTPSNIIKSARESLKKLPAQITSSQNAHKRPIKVLPQGLLFLHS